MDKINFLAKDKFPISTNTYDRLQKATSMVSTLALLGGSNYILSGCEEKEGKIEPGVVILGGEILPLLGGSPLEFVFVQETKKTLEAFDELYPEAYIDRVVIFSALGQHKWSDIKRVVSNQQLQKNIEALRGEAPGFVKDWSGLVERLSDEYMLCDGRTLNTVDYPDLAWYYGKENDASFKLPDLRGRFIAGLDNSKEDYNEIGKKGGADLVTLEKPHMPKHEHVYTDDINARNGFPNIESGFPRLYDALTSDTSAKSSGTGAAFYTTSSGGNIITGTTEAHENRPSFYVLAKVVRVKY